MPNEQQRPNEGEPQRPTRREKLRTLAKWAWIGIAYSDDLYRLIERASQIHQTITNHQ